MNKMQKLLHMEFDWACSCQEVGCEREGHKFWNIHKEVYCNICAIGIHSECGFQDTADIYFIKDAVQVADRLLETLDKQGKIFNLEKRYPGYERELRSLNDEFTLHLDALLKAYENKNIISLMDCQTSIIDFKNKMDSSQIKHQLSKLMFDRNLVLPLRGSTIEIDTSKDANRLVADTYERMAQQMAKIKDKEIEEERKLIAEEWQKKADEEVKRIKEVSEQVKEQLEKEIEEQKLRGKDLEDEVSKWSETIDKLNEKIKEKDQEIERVDNQPMFMEILKSAYNTHFGTQQDFSHKSELVLELNDSKAESFIKHYVTNKLKLPHLKKLRIDYIKENDEVLKLFLINCCPSNLEVFSFNRNTNTSSQIKISAYIPSLSKCLPAVTKQVYLYYVKIKSSGDLSTLIKASSNSENLVVRCCEVLTDDECDFGDGKYNTQLISFGYDDYNQCKWKEKPIRFDNIVEGISKSSLKGQLKVLGINESDVSKDDAEACLTKFGCQNVSVKVGGEKLM
jgi:hypothetical protein